ncbi:MAG TPA: GxxExxY protein [Phycisphaerales bacterium]|nr:GxxExxY protein [Phycisphaerales bacterium]HCD32712.1 GxxExxY protein [Phycisphaerales bacterium]|tara:strand:+ start:520 stop:906 length:387 start_codon:yes stop_codon:yes gene_type:complete
MHEPNDFLDDLARKVIGAAIEVYKQLGPGFLEQMYSKALSVELAERGIEHKVESPVALNDKGHLVGEGRLDLLIENKLIVELKAVEKLHPIHHAQVISYLKATHLHLGLLINFNVSVLKEGLQRIILS